jgi:hypothetical protein
MGADLEPNAPNCHGQLNPFCSIKPLKQDHLRSGRNICGAQAVLEGFCPEGEFCPDLLSDDEHSF